MGRTTVLMLLAACAHETNTPPEPQSSSPPPPLRVAFGTCAPETMQFVVGATTRPRVTGTTGDTFLCNGQPCGLIGEGATYARPPHDPPPPPPPENPLRTVESQLAACLRQEPEQYGTGLVEFGAQPKVIGLARPACVDKLAAELNKTAKPMRCSFAFGEMPFAKLPTLELQAAATFFNGEDRANPKQAIEQHLAETRDGPLVLQGPIAISAQPTTPMTIVRDAAVAIDDADLDVAFIAPHAFGGVRLVPSLELPPVPLPKRPRSDQPGPVAELTVTPADVVDVNALRAKLRALRKNGAGELLVHADALQYQDFVRVVDLASEEGFVQWRLR